MSKRKTAYRNFKILVFTGFLLFVLVGITSAQDDGQNQNSPRLVTRDAVTRVRLGPDLSYPFAFELPPNAEVQPLAYSANQIWVQIYYQNQYGWVDSGMISSALPADLPILNTPPVNSVLPYDRCISVVGDSVPYGSVVFMVPGHGFPVIQTKPLAKVLQESLLQRGLEYIEVRDRSVSGGYLDERGPKLYRDDPAYQELLNDRCQFIVVMPWVNDLVIVRENAPQEHLNTLERFLQEISTVSPASRIVVIGYYYVQPPEYVHGYETGGLFDDSITRHNEVIFEACAAGGRFTQIPNLTCMRIEQLFSEMNGAHVIHEFTREELSAILYGDVPIPPDVQPMFDVFWSQNPNGKVLGDGVHFSEAGKQVFIEALINELLWLEPDL